MKKYGAEFFGTFWLVLGGCGSAVLAAAFPGVGIGLLGVSLAFEGIEQEVRGAIRPPVSELQPHLSIARQMEPVLRDERPQRVPTHPLEAVPLVCVDPHVGMEVEPILARVTAPGRGSPVLVRRVAAPTAFRGGRGPSPLKSRSQRRQRRDGGGFW